MNIETYSNHTRFHVVKTLSWGADDDGHQFASVIVWDEWRDKYFLRYTRAPKGGDRVDTLEEIDTQGWEGVHERVRGVVEMHKSC